MTDEILELINKIHTPGFFITAEFIRTTDSMPNKIEEFIQQKLKMIKNGTPARKFVFTEGKWRIYITFFPTDRVVDKKYALINRVIKAGKSFFLI